MPVKYIKTILENESARTLVENKDEFVTSVLEDSIPFIQSYDTGVITANLEAFMDSDNIGMIHQEISEVVNEDVNEFLEAISMVAADVELSDEEKTAVVESAYAEIVEELSKEDMLKAGKKAVSAGKEHASKIGTAAAGAGKAAVGATNAAVVKGAGAVGLAGKAATLGKGIAAVAGKSKIGAALVAGGKAAGLTAAGAGGLAAGGAVLGGALLARKLLKKRKAAKAAKTAA